jgi:hypothetical protein
MCKVDRISPVTYKLLSAAVMLLLVVPTAQAFYFSEDIIVVNIIDDVVTGHFRITPDTSSNMTSEHIQLFVLSPFDVKLDGQTDPEFDLATYRDLDFTVDFINDVFYVSKWYNNTYVVAYSKNQTDTLRINVYVKPQTDFNYSMMMYRNFTDGTVGTFDINFTNNGNDIITASISEDCPMFDFQNDAVFYPNSKTTIYIPYSIEKTQKPGSYRCMINLDSEELGNLTDINLSYRIIDNILPEATEFMYPVEVSYGDPFRVKVKASDNVNLTNVSIDIREENDVPNKTYGLLGVGDGLYEATIKIEQIGEFYAVFVLIDGSGNKREYVKRIEVVPQGDYEYYDIKPYTIATDHEYEQLIFKSDNSVKFDLKVNELSFTQTFYDNSSNITVNSNPVVLGFIVNGKRYDMEEGQELKALEGSEIYVTIESPVEGKYGGKITFDLYEEFGAGKMFLFTGTIGKLTIIPAKTLNVGGKMISCKSNYTGVVEQSNYICEMYFPLRTDLNQISVVMTSSEFETMKSSFQTQVNYKTEQLAGMTLYATATNVVFIMIIVILGFMMYLKNIRLIIKV